MVMNMNSIVTSCTYLYEPNLTGKTPLDSNFIGLRCTRIFSMFSKIKRDKGRKMFGMSPPKKMCSCSPPVVQLKKKNHHARCNEKLGKVPDFGNLNLNIE